MDHLVKFDERGWEQAQQLGRKSLDRSKVLGIAHLLRYVMDSECPPFGIYSDGIAYEHGGEGRALMYAELLGHVVAGIGRPDPAEWAVACNEALRISIEEFAREQEHEAATV